MVISSPEDPPSGGTGRTQPERRAFEFTFPPQNHAEASGRPVRETPIATARKRAVDQAARIGTGAGRVGAQATKSSATLPGFLLSSQAAAARNP